MNHMTVSTARKNFDSIINNVTHYNELVTIVTTDNKAAVLLSMEEWNSIQETIYLQSVPGLVKSIKDGENEPLEDCFDDSELDYGI